MNLNNQLKGRKMKVNPGDLNALRALAKNKTQLAVIESLYNQIGHSKKTIQNRTQEVQAFNLAEKYPDTFKIVWVGHSIFLDFK